MKLVAYSNRPLDELQAIVQEKFAGIARKDVGIERQIEPPYDLECMGKFVELIPVKDEDCLELAWILPNL